MALSSPKRYKRQPQRWRNYKFKRAKPYSSNCLSLLASTKIVKGINATRMK